MSELRIDVMGTPAPQGSKRHVGNGRMIESSAKVGPWRDSVAWQAVAFAGECSWRCPVGPVTVDITFWLSRPRSAPKSRVWPDRKPDLDKLIRSTLDGLTTAAVIEDDARVQSITAQKVYATGEQWTGASILITDLGAPQ